MDENESLKGAMSIAEFCQAFGVKKSKVYMEVRTGKLRVVKFGARTLILARDAEAWASSLPQLVTSGAA